MELNRADEWIIAVALCVALSSFVILILNAIEEIKKGDKWWIDANIGVKKYVATIHQSI